MKKSETRYSASSIFGDSVTIIVNNEAADHIKIEYLQSVWRSRANTIKFYEWVAEQIKRLPKETV